MARILTGIQSSGRIHLGNVLGAMQPVLNLVKENNHEGIFFIADLHTLTTIKSAEERKMYTQAAAMAWLACGLDPDAMIFFQQSHVPEVTELTWYLHCYTPYPMLANAHAFKDKAEHLSEVNAGLFSYPVLMAADILLYDTEEVLVGKDQQQHLEITRDLARSINHRHGALLTVPELCVQEDTGMVPGLDGRKMSKSYHNTLDIFAPEKALRKEIMGIETDSLPLEAPKDPTSCTVFQLYKLVAPQEAVDTMRSQYLAGGYGYGTAKNTLFEQVIDRFSTERAAYQRYEQDPGYVKQILAQGAVEARTIATATLARVRECLGYDPRP